MNTSASTANSAARQITQLASRSRWHTGCNFYTPVVTSLVEERMQEAKKVRELAEAASHLCAAFDELSAAGYGAWSDELKQFIEIIAAEIGWLQTPDVTRTV